MWKKSSEDKTFEAFKSLLVTYLKDVEKFVYVITNKNNQIKEEIVQNTFVSAIEHWSQLRSWSKMKSWLFSIAKNEAKMYYRKNPFSVELEDEVVFKETGASEALLRDVSDLLVRGEINKELNDAILLLRENEQRIIMMYHYFDIDLKEIADILNVNYNTVRTLHKRSLEKLKRTLLELKESAGNG